MKPKSTFELQEEIDRQYGEGKIPICYYCQKPDCYVLSIYTDPVTEKDTFVKTYFTDEGQVVCKRCHNFMVNIGKPITVIFHWILRTYIFFERIINFILRRL